MNTLPPLHTVWLPRTDYLECLQWQRRAVEARAAGRIPDVVVFTSHPPVVTLGRGFHGTLALARAPVVPVERGGKATFHGPGQCIGYPILLLSETERDLHAYLRHIEDAIIGTLNTYGLAAEREPGATGVWVPSRGGEKRKIASIGVAVRHWVTFHGFALNVSTDLRGFEGFDPCGFPSGVMTSLDRELGRETDPLELRGRLAHSLALAFGRELDPRDFTTPWLEIAAVEGARETLK